MTYANSVFYNYVRSSFEVGDMVRVHQLGDDTICGRLENILPSKVRVKKSRMNPKDIKYDKLLLITKD